MELSFTGTVNLGISDEKIAVQWILSKPHEIQSSKNWVAEKKGAEKLLLSDINFLTTPLPSIPLNMPLSENFVIMLQRRTTNMQRCSEAYATMSKLYCCSDIASALDSKINLQCTLKLYWQRCCNVEIATLNSLRLQNVDTTTSNLKRYTSIASP